MEHILLVDGSNLLFQMFYGMPARILGKNGRPIHGTLGFLGALRKILAWQKPDYMAVLFDGECGNVRKTVDIAYKANRPDFAAVPEEDTPFSQLPDIFRALECLGIRYAETTCCETDDWIAACTAAWSSRGRITIVSQDSDFFQLISHRVQVLRYRGERSVICDEAYIQEKLGIRPCQYADYKALAGDTADNIRGADRIGPKTAAWLLGEYGDIPTLLARAEEIARPAIRQSVLQNRQRILTNQQLICLSGEGELPFALEELVYTGGEFSTREILERIGL